MKIHILNLVQRYAKCHKNKMNESRLDILLTSLIPAAPDAFLLYAIALEYRSLDQPALALDYFRQVLAHDPSYLATYYQLAALYLSLGKTAEAETTWLKGIEVAGLQGKQHTLNELRNAYRQFKDEDEF